MWPNPVHTPDATRTHRRPSTIQYYIHRTSDGNCTSGSKMTVFRLTSLVPTRLFPTGIVPPSPLIGGCLSIIFTSSLNPVSLVSHLSQQLNPQTHTHSHTMACGKKKNHGKFDDNNNNNINDSNDIADHNATATAAAAADGGGGKQKKGLDPS